MRIVVLLFVIGLLSSGCAHKFTQQKVETNLIKGKTTQQMVLAVFGEPDRKYMTPGMNIVSGGKSRVMHKPYEVWLYTLHQSKLINFLKPEQLRIIFNSDRIVSNYYYEVGSD